MVVVLVLRIDLGLRPSEDTERVVRSEVGEGREIAPSRIATWGGVEELVADEVVVGRVWG
ncbi:hypothetical protein Bca52824_013121 [Brassica carinata]|uniref:Uncharacterized protein n=1 Tax=Brassica carinata TaxID=52824 RepID=A0A8X7VXF4_BRACI|nr:hypothetical protein Bca52824_013121 [Brassica carinata]